MQDRPSSLPLSRLSLRERERGLVLGGVGTGKSTLADVLGQEFVNRYRSQNARRLILDSKPRYRGEWLVNGISAKRRYKRWDHGEAIRNSVICDDPHDLERAFHMAPNVICQGESGADIPRLVECAEAFLRSSRAGRPQLLQVDEAKDYYHENGMSRGGNDAILRSVRAGRERGTGCLICSQRTKGIPPSLMEELSRCYLFRMDYRADAKRLQEMGAPATMGPPRRAHEFIYWTKDEYEKVYGPYVLALPRR
jgi:hypothetical protein